MRRLAKINVRFGCIIASQILKGGVFVLDFTWKIFSQTGNIDTYLLFKELEKEKQEIEIPSKLDEELAQIDYPIL